MITEMTKEAKDQYPMSEERFWEIVKIADWPNKDHNDVTAEYLKFLFVEEGIQLRRMSGVFFNMLDKVVGQRNPAGGGDDSHSDLLYHIIGLGREQFYAHLNDYSLIEKRGQSRYDSAEGYKESFAYCMPYEDDWEKIDPKKTAEIRTEIDKRKEKQEKAVPLKIQTVLDNITDVLTNADGAFVAEIHNQVCSDKIVYIEDDEWSYA